MSVASLLLGSLFLQSPKLDSDTQKLFAWFDSLGNHQYLSRPFVGVRSEFAKTNEFVNDAGFLISEDPTSFTILSLNLASITYLKDRPNRNGSEFKTVPLDFQTFVQSEIKNLHGPKQPTPKIRMHRLEGYPFEPVPESLAWCSTKMGFSRESAEIIRLGKRARLAKNRNATKKLSYVESVQHEVVNGVGERALDWFQDRELSRKDLLARFTGLCDQFQGSPFEKEFETIRDTLKEMVHEDTFPPKFPNTEDGEIARHIWNLRDTFPMVGESQIALEKLGMRAVPGLLEALEDERYSRGIRRTFLNPELDFGASRIFTVGERAAGVISTIAKRHFYVSSPDQFASAARRWYLAEVNRGREGRLYEAMRTGGPDGAGYASDYVREFPDSAFETLTSLYGLDGSDSHAFVRLIAGLNDPRKKTFLVNVAENSEYQTLRATALRGLFVSDPEYALKRGLDELRNLNEPYDAKAALPQLATLQVLSGSATRVREVTKIASKQPLEMRARIVGNLYREDYLLSRALNKPGATDYAGALEDHFIQELDRLGKSKGPSNLSVQSQVIFSTIACLSLYFPNTYPQVVIKPAIDIEQLRDSALAIYRQNRKKRAS